MSEQGQDVATVPLSPDHEAVISYLDGMKTFLGSQEHVRKLATVYAKGCEVPQEQIAALVEGFKRVGDKFLLFLNANTALQIREAIKTLEAKK